MLGFEDVTKRFGEMVAVDHLSLEVPEGRTTVLIGTSGCGKSTLLRMLVGLEQPTSGRLLVDGIEVGPETLKDVRRRIGYVIQEGGLFPHLTARQNVALAVRPLGWTDDRVEPRMLELAELAHLPKELLDRYPGELSGGQRQRVSLIRALLPDPSHLLMDEPFGALDPLVRFELRREFREIVTTTNKTVLLVTHDLAEAGILGDEVVLMQTGRIVQQGPFSELMEKPANDFAAQFIEAQSVPGAAS